MSFRSFFIEQRSHTETNFSSPITFGDPEFSTNKMLPRLKAHFLPRSIITEAFVFAVHGWGGRRSHGRWRFVQSLGEDDPGTQLDEWRIGGPGTLLVGSLQNLDGGIYPMLEHFQDLGMNSRKSFLRWLDEWDLPIWVNCSKVISDPSMSPRTCNDYQMTSGFGSSFLLEEFLRTFSFHWYAVGKFLISYPFFTGRGENLCCCHFLSVKKMWMDESLLHLWALLGARDGMSRLWFAISFGIFFHQKWSKLLTMDPLLKQLWGGTDFAFITGKSILRAS